MQAYKDKLHAALREIAECPVSMRTVEQAAAVTDLLCRLDKLEDHDEPETVEFDRETAMQWAANMQTPTARQARTGRWNRQRLWPRAWAFRRQRSRAGHGA